MSDLPKVGAYYRHHLESVIVQVIGYSSATNKYEIKVIADPTSFAFETADLKIGDSYFEVVNKVDGDIKEIKGYNTPLWKVLYE